jgi:hypothetical protein
VPAAPTIVLGLLLGYVLHIQIGIGFVPTLLIGMAFAAISGYLQRRRDQRR